MALAPVAAEAGRCGKKIFDYPPHRSTTVLKRLFLIVRMRKTNARRVQFRHGIVT
ncbi:hypothetical protein ABH944_004197 [Caballeronia udeis]|uniref:Uncharacterized protein n=1 Tax=Caballeronia udeis TaxID=1232866 RepID=A0ABW8ML74_9BURK